MKSRHRRVRPRAPAIRPAPTNVLARFSKFLERRWQLPASVVVLLFAFGIACFLATSTSAQVRPSQPSPPTASSQVAQAGLLRSLEDFFKKLWNPAASGAEQQGIAYMYDEEGNLLSETGTGGANSTGSKQYIYLPTASGAMPVAVIIDGKPYAIHADHLNTPRRLTDSKGQVVWQWAYSAFGDDQPTQLANRFADPELTPNAGTTGASPIEFNLRYPGQYFDKESGLFYNMRRSYDKNSGRYTQPDPIGLDGGWNRFGYANANPLGFIDPDGLQTKGIRNAVSALEGGTGTGGVGGGGGWTPGMIGAGAGAWIGTNVTGPMLAKAPQNAYDPNGPKAPGKPGEAEGFMDPKGGENWVPNPNPGRGGSSHGWQDAKGDVWCPSGPGGRAHGGPHWDVQTPGGDYRNVKPKR